MRNDSSRRARFTQWLILAMFAAVLAGCFQTAGSGIEPTVADLTSIATVQGQPTPTFPPFITPIPTGGAFVPPADDPLIIPSPTTDPARLVTPTQHGAPGGAVPTRTSISIFGPTPTQNTGMIVPPTQIPGLSASPTQNLGVLPPPTQNPGVLPPPTVAPGVPPNPTPQGLLPTPTALPTDPPCLHTVQPGEWFYSIARKYNLNPADLIAANPHFPRPDQLQPGDVLNIPNCKQPDQPALQPTPTIIPSGSTPATGFIDATLIPLIDRIYTVAPGDTLGAIARKFNTTVQAIRDVNGLTDDRLSIGQQLKIPKAQAQ